MKGGGGMIMDLGGLARRALARSLDYFDCIVLYCIVFAARAEP